MPLYWVDIKLRTIVRAEHAAMAVELARDEATQIMGQEGEHATFTADSLPIRSVSELPKEWRGASLPWGIESPERTCEQLLTGISGESDD